MHKFTTQLLFPTFLKLSVIFLGAKIVFAHFLTNNLLGSIYLQSYNSSLLFVPCTDSLACALIAGKCVLYIVEKLSSSTDSCCYNKLLLYFEFHI